jgi:superfamily II DNA/RNA helicase
MAYLIRLEFLDESFKEDLEKILRMAPYHIDMMISTAIQMAMASQAKQPGVKAINVKVIKTLIEFSQNIMQGLWDKDSPYW